MFGISGGGSIITRQPDKVTPDFQYSDGLYYKKVILEELEDVFEVKHIVFYDTNHAEVSKEWEIPNSSEGIKGDEIQIIYSDGIIPGWKEIDHNVCSFYVKTSDISWAKEMRVYKRKNNVTLPQPLFEERSIEVNDLIGIHLSFCRDNL